MIILIGGSSHVGKTLLAHRLIEKYHFPCLSLDCLKMAFIRTNMTTLTVNDDYELRYFLWPFAAEMAKAAIESGQDMIIEGCYIPDEWRQSFDAEHLRHIRCLFVVMSEEYIRGNFDKICGFASAVERRTGEQLDMERLVRCSRSFKEGCERCGTDYIEIDRRFDADELVAAVDELVRTAPRYE